MNYTNNPIIIGIDHGYGNIKLFFKRFTFSYGFDIIISMTNRDLTRYDMKLFISFSARKIGNCAQIIDFIKTPQDKVIYYKDLNTHGCSNCSYDCFQTQCRFRDDDVYRLYSSFESYEKVILLVPMYCGNPSSLYFSFNERGQDFFMHHENEYISFVERLFIIGVYGSKKESPDFIRCFEKWFEGTSYQHHVLGIERHLYQQTMKDSVMDIESVKMALHGFIR